MSGCTCEPPEFFCDSCRLDEARVNRIKELEAERDALVARIAELEAEHGE